MPGTVGKNRRAFMNNWTPLWSTIIDSSVWGESKDVKILWITMLAKKDKNGYVEAPVAGLSRAAVLIIAETEAALAVLEAPDQYSRTPDNEGRRIRKVDSGWCILNHRMYRDEIAKVRQREQQRAWQQDYRDRLKAEKNGGPDAGGPPPGVPPETDEEREAFERHAGKPFMGPAPAGPVHRQTTSTTARRSNPPAPARDDRSFSPDDIEARAKWAAEAEQRKEFLRRNSQ